MHKHHRYITLSGHFFGASALVVQQGAVRRAGRATFSRQWKPRRAKRPRYQHKLAAAEDDEILAKIDPKENEIIRLTPAERDGVRESGRAGARASTARTIDPKLFEYLS